MNLQDGIALHPVTAACGCIGPQRGEPYCPCEMRAKRVEIINGRYVQPARDLGPALPAMSAPLADYLRTAHRSD